MRGSAYGEAGRTNRRSPIRQGDGLDPDYAQAYANRALLYRHINDLDPALADYDKALSMKPHTRPPISAAASSTVCTPGPCSRSPISTRRSRCAPTMRKPTTIAACSIRARASIDSPSTFSLPRSDSRRRGRKLTASRSLLSRRRRRQGGGGDLDQAVQLNPADPKAWASRGLAERLGQNERPPAPTPRRSISTASTRRPSPALPAFSSQVGQSYQTCWLTGIEAVRGSPG